MSKLFKHHVAHVHQGQEVQFASCWDKKEVTNPRRRKVPSTDSHNSPPKVVSSPSQVVPPPAQPVTQLPPLTSSASANRNFVNNSSYNQMLCQQSPQPVLSQANYSYG